MKQQSNNISETNWEKISTEDEKSDLQELESSNYYTKSKI